MQSENEMMNYISQCIFHISFHVHFYLCQRGYVYSGVFFLTHCLQDSEISTGWTSINHGGRMGNGPWKKLFN